MISLTIYKIYVCHFAHLVEGVYSGEHVLKRVNGGVHALPHEIIVSM